MRLLVASLVVAVACGPKPKPESPLVNEGPPTADNCCCKTIPMVSEKDIEPQFAMAGRMECSTKQGTCVDNVQCSGQDQGSAGSSSTPTQTDTGVPPPPDLPAKTDTGVPPPPNLPPSP